MNTPAELVPTDLIAVKAAEYQNLPGMILGLDGWILRSVPPGLRTQFLAGYEKLLRVVFHPDRYQDNDKKQSRLVYLQSVNEAVRYMLSDEFAYETTTDTVPTRKNPIVTLQNAIEVRDSIIARIDEDLSTSSSRGRTLSAEVSALRMDLLRTRNEADRRATLDHRLRQITTASVRGHPVPIGAKFAKVGGSFLNWGAGREDSQLLARMADNASASSVSPDHEWVRKASWLGVAREEGIMEKSCKLNFKISLAQGSPQKMMIAGMTIAHLCEFVRANFNFPEAPLSVADLIVCLNALEKPMLEAEGAEFYRGMSAFTLPYYSAGMMLLVRIEQLTVAGAARQFRHRLLAVTSVDFGESPARAEADGLRFQVQQMEADFRARLKRKQNRISKLNGELRKLRKKQAL